MKKLVNKDDPSKEIISNIITDCVDYYAVWNGTEYIKYNKYEYTLEDLTEEVINKKFLLIMYPDERYLTSFNLRVEVGVSVEAVLNKVLEECEHYKNGKNNLELSKTVYDRIDIYEYTTANKINLKESFDRDKLEQERIIEKAQRMNIFIELQKEFTPTTYISCNACNKSYTYSDAVSKITTDNATSDVKCIITCPYCDK